MLRGEDHLLLFQNLVSNTHIIRWLMPVCHDSSRRSSTFFCPPRTPARIPIDSHADILVYTLLLRDNSI